MSRRPSLFRKAFTLVEVLAAIAIIGVLAAMTLGLYGYVKVARSEAKARGDIAVMKAKLEEFKNLYGEYPMAQGNSADDWQRTLFDALTGKKVLERDTSSTTGKPKYKWSAEIDEKKRKPLVGENEIITDSVYAETPTVPAKWFVDPWGNPYQYRFGKLTNGRPDAAWENPGFLIISAGAKFTEPFKADAECFSGSMDTDGRVDTKTYFEDPIGMRNDNLTSFGDK